MKYLILIFFLSCCTCDPVPEEKFNKDVIDYIYPAGSSGDDPLILFETKYAYYHINIITGDTSSVQGKSEKFKEQIYKGW